MVATEIDTLAFVYFLKPLPRKLTLLVTTTVCWSCTSINIADNCWERRAVPLFKTKGIPLNYLLLVITVLTCLNNPDLQSFLFSCGGTYSRCLLFGWNLYSNHILSKWWIHRVNGGHACHRKFSSARTGQFMACVPICLIQQCNKWRFSSGFFCRTLHGYR